MRHQNIRVLATIVVAVWLTGCGSPAPAPTASATLATPTPATPSAVDIHITGADVAQLVSAVPVPCSGGVGNDGQPLLGVALDAIRDASGAQTALNLTIVGYESTGTYDATAVWAADGATAVTLDPQPNEPIASERFVAESGSVTVTSAQATEVAGSIDANLIPETPTTGPAPQVEVSGTWSCDE
jgi:hypothetical protein